MYLKLPALPTFFIANYHRCNYGMTYNVQLLNRTLWNLRINNSFYFSNNKMPIWPHKFRPKLKRQQGLLDNFPIRSSTNIGIGAHHVSPLFSIPRSVTIRGYHPCANLRCIVQLDPLFFAAVYPDWVVVHKLSNLHIKCIAVLDSDHEHFSCALVVGDGRIVLTTNCKRFHIYQWDRAHLHVMSRLTCKRTIDVPFPNAILAECLTGTGESYKPEYFALWRSRSKTTRSEPVVLVYRADSLDQVGVIKQDVHRTIRHVLVSFTFLMICSVGKSDPSAKGPDLCFLSLYSIPSLRLLCSHETNDLLVGSNSKDTDKNHYPALNSKASDAWSSFLRNVKCTKGPVLYFRSVFNNLLPSVSFHESVPECLPRSQEARLKQGTENLQETVVQRKRPETLPNGVSEYLSYHDRLPGSAYNDLVKPRCDVCVVHRDRLKSSFLTARYVHRWCARGTGLNLWTFFIKHM